MIRRDPWPSRIIALLGHTNTVNVLDLVPGLIGLAGTIQKPVVPCDDADVQTVRGLIRHARGAEDALDYVGLENVAPNGILDLGLQCDRWADDMDAVLVLVMGGIGLGRRLEHHEELEGISTRWRLEEAGEGVGIGRNELTDLFGREAAAKGTTCGITEVEVNQNRSVGLVFLQEGAGTAITEYMIMCET